MIRGKSALAIWSDVAPEIEVDYRHWLTREHVLERVGIDGFLAGRVFQLAREEPRRYFITYELEDSSAVAGPSYLTRLNAPTPWSQRMMPQLRNFARGGGNVVARAGLGSGGYCAPLRCGLGRCADAGTAQKLVERVAAFDAISAVWFLAVDRQATTVPTRERNMRKSSEGDFEAVLCIEGLAAEPVRAAARSALGQELAGEAVDPVTDIPVFAATFALDRRTAGLLPAA